MKTPFLAALAVLLTSTCAMAQSNVTLYGVVDLGLERTKLSPGDATTRLSSGIQAGSRWGLKGTEDLGDGLSASFQLEQGFDASTGVVAQGGRGFGRQAWVGLNGSFGSVKLGRQYTPIFLALDNIDPFGTGITGDGSGMSAVFRAYGLRMDNTFNYSTPSIPGFSAQLAYGLGEMPGSTSKGSQYGGMATYSGGPVTVVGSFHNQNPVAAGADAGKARTTLIGGAYDFKVVSIHAAFADNRDHNAAGNATERSRDMMLGVSAPISQLSLMASFIRHKDKLLSNADADYWQLGATYAMSKRTNFYTSYSIIRNEVRSAVGSGAADTDISWLNLGIRHRF